MVSKWTASLMPILLAGCSATGPVATASNPAASADDPAAQAVDIRSMPTEQRKSVLDWVDYICSLPPEQRVEAMKAAPPGYVLVTGDAQQQAATAGPTMGFTCPHQ